MSTQLCVASIHLSTTFAFLYQHVVTSGSYPLFEISHTSFGLLLVRTFVFLYPDADPVPDQAGAARGRGRGRGNWRAGRRGGGGRRGR